MNIIVRNEYRVEAQLSAEELRAYGITYEELDYKNIETRRVLWLLSEKIRSTYGIGINFSGRLLIEVIKEKEDMIRICFSQLSDSLSDEKSVKQLVKSENTPVVAEFSDIEAVLSLLFFVREEFSASFYEKSGKYRLVFNVAQNEKEKLVTQLCEFSEILSFPQLENARCKEHWNCIIENDAVKKLTEAFSVTR